MPPPDPNPPTLPPPSDVAQIATGVLVLPGVLVGVRPVADPYGGASGAQIALDGRDERPAPSATGEAGASPLGPYTGFCTDPPATPPTPDVPPRQLPLLGVLDLADLEAIPQLSLTDRRYIAGALADREGMQTERQSEGAQDRMAKCCHDVRRVAGESPSGFMTERRSWSWSGLVRCNEWCCPSCGPRRARDTSAHLDCVLSTWRAATAGGLLQPDVWMLTLTTPHAADDGADTTLDTLYEAHGLFLRSKAWRAFARRFGVASTVRVLDVTFGGPSGPHPHFHVALLPCHATVTGAERRHAATCRPDVLPDLMTSAAEQARAAMIGAHIRAERQRALDPAASWPDASLADLETDERISVLRSFEGAVRSAWADAIYAITGARPASSACLRLSPGEDAAFYFASWGLHDEVSATAVKRRSHLRLLDAVAAGHAVAGAEFAAWREAVKGRAWVTGLGRARRRLHLTADDVAEHRKERQRQRDNNQNELAAACLAEPVRLVEPISIRVPAVLWPAAVELGRWRVEAEAERARAAGEDPQAAIEAFILRGLRELRGPPE